MEYLGCQKEHGICDKCRTTFEYLHLMEYRRRRRRFCLHCAIEAASRGADGQVPEFTEARCRQEGGKWVSAKHGEKAYDQAQGETFG